MFSKRPFLLPMLLAALCIAVPAARADFGVKDDGKSFTIDCGSTAPLFVQINKSNGDIQSMVYHGTALQKGPRNSHINSGLGKADVTSRLLGEDRILITVTTPNLLQYYAFKKGDPAIYMATWAATCPPPGEMRFIARLDRRVFSMGNPDRPGDGTSDKAIESKDIFIQPDGTTTSKYYSGVKFINDNIHGTRGPNIGAWFAIGSHESCSGGPFFRDINTQTTSDTEELYFYMFSGHAQTEEFRKNQLHGPYALCFTNGSVPTMPAMGWMKDLGLKGWVTERGRLSGSATGLMRGVPYTVYLANDAAQYWARVGPDGKYATPAIKPGTYQVQLMRDELAVAKASVTVGTTLMTQDFVDPGLKPYLWRLGLPDGTPKGFRNADKMGDMHPSDKRLAPWGPVTFNIREAVAANLNDFPAAQFQDVNSGNRIAFNLTAERLKDRDLEIGVTDSQYGSRPIIKVNDKWSNPPPPAPRSYDSRSITFGIYRGFDVVHTIRIPASAFRVGANVITIQNLSGTGMHGFISNAMVFDYIGLRD